MVGDVINHVLDGCHLNSLLSGVVFSCVSPPASRSEKEGRGEREEGKGR